MREGKSSARTRRGKGPPALPDAAHATEGRSRSGLAANYLGRSAERDRDCDAPYRGDPSIAQYRGRIVKTTGDGLLAEFASVVDALRCATEVQNAIVEGNAGVVAEKRMNFE